MDLKKLFKKRKENLNVEIGKREIYPIRDWKIMVIGTIFLSILLAIIGTYFYINANSSDPFSSAENSPNPSKQFINKSALKEALGLFEDKEKIRQDIIDGSGAVKDPSR